ncbi:hypothetical protein [Arthrobacter sp. MMS18-M83]|uniref:hypothetical protein n=1 Tax=Arthrobacter sp. MMS18-M83 TaxID=2996261 RepID=UPI00227AC8BA|nr:hypothetical protein [Arthrobacter sp. MMS18-M83]WAH99012.1 hypothetical protein OW521_09400 [Arthrobacter sp. MMS18-M83]
MEKKQTLTNEQALEPQNIEFHVSYLDADSGRIEHEEFSDRAAAERFANAQLNDEESWAVVDVVALQPALQPGQQQGRAQQLVA